MSCRKTSCDDAPDLDTGELVSTASHRTTVGTDVLHGLDAAVGVAVGAAEQASAGTTATSTMYVCSSAGGGLRLAVVGYESLVTAEAGHRVGLSAGHAGAQYNGARGPAG